MEILLKDKILKHLEKNSLSVSEFERNAGLKPSAIRNILYGKSKSPTVDTVGTIAKELGMTIDMLMCGSEANEPKFVSNNIDVNLLRKSSDYLLKEVASLDIKIEIEPCMDLIKSAYSYALKKGKVDKDFIEWMISRL